MCPPIFHSQLLPMKETYAICLVGRRKLEQSIADAAAPKMASFVYRFTFSSGAITWQTKNTRAKSHTPNNWFTVILEIRFTLHTLDTRGLCYVLYITQTVC